MADKKISALTGATTPLAGTEVLPIVQSGSTVKVAVSDLTAGRTVSATSVTAGLGAVGTPAYTFTGDTNTGMWSPAANIVAFSTDGVERLRVDASGNLLVGLTSPAYAEFVSLQKNQDAQTYQLIRNTSTGSSAYTGYYISASGNSWGIRAGSAVANSNSLQFVVDALGAPVARMTLDTSGNLTANSGNLVIGTANKGIDFSANPSAPGMTSELLNDYEEGTWTPTDASGAGLVITITAGTTPTYVKIGRLVVCSADVTYPATANATTARLSLPFAGAAASPSGGGMVGFKSDGVFMVGSTSATGSVFLSPVNTFLTNANLSGVRFQMSWTYQV